MNKFFTMYNKQSANKLNMLQSKKYKIFIWIWILPEECFAEVPISLSISRVRNAYIDSIPIFDSFSCMPQPFYYFLYVYCLFIGLFFSLTIFHVPIHQVCTQASTEGAIRAKKSPKFLWLRPIGPGRSRRLRPVFRRFSKPTFGFACAGESVFCLFTADTDSCFNDR